MKGEAPAKVVRFVKIRLERLLATPDLWGPPESVELQVLLLLEVRLAAMGLPDEDVYRLPRRYKSYLNDVVDGPPTTLARRLGLKSRATQQFTEVLRSFVERETGALVDSEGAPIATMPLVDRDGPVHIEA